MIPLSSNWKNWTGRCAMSFGDDADIIHSYTRAQAIEDGTFVDVSSVAQEAGITFPVALTACLWAIIEPTPQASTRRDVKGRLWDVVSLLRRAIGQATGPVSELSYTVEMPHGDEKELRLNAMCGPGDTGEPVITVMLLDID
jgi:hypothetical protein